MEIEIASQMRLAMRRLASGVSVLSAIDADKSQLAMTVSSVTSVSDAPPSLLVCVSRNARVAEAILKTKKFAINLLASNQEDISRLCADPDRADERFTKEAWNKDPKSDLWFLESSPAVIFCELAANPVHGTHYIFIGNITHTLFPSSYNDLLLYLNGSYRTAPFEV